MIDHLELVNVEGVALRLLQEREAALRLAGGGGGGGGGVVEGAVQGGRAW